MRAASCLGTANFLDLDIHLKDCLPRRYTIVLSNALTDQIPSFVKLYRLTLCADIAVTVSLLSRMREETAARDTSHIVLCDVVRTTRIVFIKKLLAQARSIFCDTPLIVVTCSSAVGKRLRSFQHKYRIEVIVISRHIPLGDVFQLYPKIFEIR